MNYNYAVIAIALTGILGGGLLSLTQNTDTDIPETSSELQTFSSEEEFRSYIESSSGSAGYTQQLSTQERLDTTDELTAESGAKDSSANPERYSETNVQVENVDEPDILKTNGEQFYFSPETSYYPVERRVASDVIYPGAREENISVFNTLPVENISEEDKIPENGEMLLRNNTLVIFSGSAVKGYDVSNSSSPEEIWDLKLDSSVVTSRMTGGKVYMVLKDHTDSSDPCPVRPLKAGDQQVSIPCTSISYDPDGNAGSTYTVVSFDPETGETESETSFVGPSRNTEVYMSQDSIYITYLKQKDRSEVMLEFFEDDRGILDQETRDRIDEIGSYNISDQSKITEIRRAIEKYKASMDNGEEFEKELENRFGNYTNDRKRELERTGIVRIDADEELSVDQKGEVPGNVLNQFSMDEHEGNVRIATTVEGQFRLNIESENDVYILDKETLDIKGGVTGMGVTEEVYSARFIDDKAYLVTFRRIDPFHVLDLSEPENPELKGELKLPGYSSYLHPLDEDQILGIGEENNSVKSVIFDVSDLENPRILDDKIIDEYSSEIGRNHHAFLIDRKHEIFFLPAAEKGYIFSYEDGIEKVKEVNVQDPKRARYINDYLYIFGNEELVVLNETNWEEINRLEFAEKTDRDDEPIKPRPE